MIFESPPWRTWDNGSGKIHQRYKWTDDPAWYGRFVPGTRNTVLYARIDRVVLHEFGHMLGLPDFYLYNDTDSLMAIMNETKYPISDNEDIDQLRAIYIKHQPH